MKIHCLFEQSNTFRDAARRLGHEAESYDLPGTGASHGLDLVAAIEEGALNEIARGDFVIAFFPCTYFANTLSNKGVYAGAPRLRRYPHGAPIPQEAMEKRREAARRHRAAFLKLRALARERGWRLAIENPLSSTARPGAISDVKPDFVIPNRSLWGDAFHKPTAFYSENVRWPLMLPALDYGAYRRVERAKSALRSRVAQRVGLKSPGGWRRWSTSLVMASGSKGGMSRSLLRSAIAPAFADNFLKWLLPANE